MGYNKHLGARRLEYILQAFMIVTTKMREQKPGATFVERLLGVERRVPYQRGRGSTKSEGG